MTYKKKLRWAMVQTERCPHCNKNIRVIDRDFSMDEESLSSLQRLVRAVMRLDP